MRITERRQGGVLVLDVDGGSDGSPPGLLSHVEEVLDRGEKQIVLNLRVHSFDSSALGETTVCWIKARHRGAALKIASRQPKVWDLIRTLRLDRVLDCYRSEEEALDSLTQRSG
jgi:anti-anti-sigma factor